MADCRSFFHFASAFRDRQSSLLACRLAGHRKRCRQRSVANDTAALMWPGIVNTKQRPATASVKPASAPMPGSNAATSARREQSSF
jgi:hypothetical protein